MRLQAPFPYFGGKSRVASLVWERLGDVSYFGVFPPPRSAAHACLAFILSRENGRGGFLPVGYRCYTFGAIPAPFQAGAPAQCRSR